ncbi:hypothetical protein BC830DRAFT_1130029 [Chytriomyces sp. MP71]|nr:hypothetical protein BC830DRAFT_1130029 [Chytriomyces sp. MP71]
MISTTTISATIISTTLILLRTLFRNRSSARPPQSRRSRASLDLRSCQLVSALLYFTRPQSPLAHPSFRMRKKLGGCRSCCRACACIQPR